MLARGEGEVVAELTSPLTALVFAEFVRLPRERALELNAHSEAFERAQQQLDTDTAERENQWLYEACRQLVRERRAEPLEPTTDIVSALLLLEQDDEFVAGSVRQLVIAAHVAPTAAIASAVRHVAEDAALQTALRDEPALHPGGRRRAAAALHAQPGLRPHGAAPMPRSAAARSARASRSRSC